MDIFTFIYNSDPTKVRVVEQEQNEGEPLLLDTTIGRTVPLLSVALDHAKSELEASVDRPLMKVLVETKQDKGILQESRRQGKRKSMIVDAGGVSHPPKKLRKDHETLSGTSVGHKSWSALQRLLARAVLNAEVRVAAIPTLPFLTASISTMLEHEDGDHTNFVAKLNLRTIGSSIPIMTSVTTITSTVNLTLVTREKPVEPFSFGVGSSSAGGTDPITGVFSDLTSSDFLSVTNGSHLDDGRICREMVDEFAPLKFFVSVDGMKHDQLSTEFNVEAAHQMSLSAEIRMRAEEKEIGKLKAQMLLREAKTTKAIRLRAEASNIEAVQKSLRDEMNALRERNAILEKERNALDVKVIELETSTTGKEHELTELNALITSVTSKNDNLADHLITQGMELAIIKCLNSPEYLSALEATIGKDIEKGMQDGLSTRITHGKEGRVLIDVAPYNPSAEVDYISALQQLHNVIFPLLAELKSNKNASIETVMDILYLEGPLVDKLGLDELQPNVDQLMVPIHQSPNKVIIGVSLCMEGTSSIMSIADNTTTALSIILGSASTVPLITIEDYEVIGTDDPEDAQGSGQGEVASFPNTVMFEKEELGTTSERDPPS
uniref:Transposase (Putative), gypsy type n=1 Tax=Tanacetum cinerariifolium TaxID=118510 RepID=A0A6L2JQK3_TANCI|nr:hypothetical protein [Tanacetum cinerariifolium]